MRRLVCFMLVAWLGMLACHRQPSDGGGSGSRYVITREEIDAVNASSVYDVVARLRGEYLRDRGVASIKTTNRRSRAVVFMNEQEYGVLETMRNIPPGRVAEIRYFPGTEAAARFGSQYGGGVIQLIPRHD